ncbi:hypothetical protein BJ165DRAFT_1451947 [Panaeolus papilionaceus]|nr:hypothetical protein BJ165DRAFT_1451947 [Panaeolus papilionaceus]
MSSPNLYRMAPRLLKRPVSPDEEDEYKPRTKSPRAIPDDNPVYLRRMLARGLPVGESPETLKGEHIPVYSEAEKKIKYEWMKGSHEFLTANPPVLRKNWRVPVPKANEVAVDPSPPAQPKDEIHHVGETTPPEYRKQLPPNPLKSLPSTSQPPTRRPVVEPKYSSLAHHPSKTSTIPTSTTEYRASKLRSKIHEVSVSAVYISRLYLSRHLYLIPDMTEGTRGKSFIFDVNTRVDARIRSGDTRNERRCRALDACSTRK